MTPVVALPGVTWPERVVERLALLLGRRRSGDDGEPTEGPTRRTVLVRFALFASALSIGPLRFILRPGSAYATVCGDGAGCGSGWTAFCCTINSGRNTCPDGSFAAGWWKNDTSSFCNGRPRYIIDCNATCPTSCVCRCSGSNTCDQRKTCCNQFRYGQCHQEIACAGPVVCRIATCSAPWEFDPSCGTGSATDNRTSEHGAPCILGIDHIEPTADVFPFDAPSLGSPVDSQLMAPMVGMAVTPTGRGYWLAGADGGIFNYGDAAFHGSTGGIQLNRPIVGIAGSPTGKGYWLVASDGGIFSFGDARFFGSTGSMRLNKPIVGMAATPTGSGYWLVASDGGIFTFGDATFHGSTGAMTLNKPIVGMDAALGGKGYWLVASDGGIFTFGGAGFLGSMGGTTLQRPVVGMTRTSSGRGYWLVAADGGVFSFGDAVFHGAISRSDLGDGAAVGIAAAPPGATAPTTSTTGGFGITTTTTRAAGPNPGYWIVVRR